MEDSMRGTPAARELTPEKIIKTVMEERGLKSDTLNNPAGLKSRLILHDVHFTLL
jgi:hypothetical protein